MKKDILMVGVGGQGIVLASDILCDVALLEGYDVKKSEIHGMAQRGGSVVSHVRVGDKVFSPVIPVGEADVIVSYENMEFLRYLEYKNNNTMLILNTNRIYPPPVAMGEADYPDELIEKEKKNFKELYEIDALKIAKESGNVKVVSTVMLGALAKLLPFKKDSWYEVIRMRVPKKVVDVNIKAFDLGYAH
ncbi:indolepyruvate oxidoreductase subunit beta [Deferribacter autotrophicus]|uniref:Indolepyruvate oxidoreductase subunit beta n=1 Tax=Deferribacter autotrophicus TaxID=500465 RepID=A0A5A8F3V9_9BACT|nr:indolepyruvate oxidoreductase subunit beta [Deferribacter autotrophicus]KAA0258059.1 indolepyruvate oxidoreductase subunit beta [Deferribacter autotrophicus]